MTHTVTWQCARCNVQRASIAGSRFLLYKGHKRRICPECITELNLPPRKEHRRASCHHA